jgi:uncharacterized membrane protein
MRKLVFILIAFIALTTLIRAVADEADSNTSSMNSTGANTVQRAQVVQQAGGDANIL